MDQLKLQQQGVLAPSHPAYRTFAPSVAIACAAILALFCAFVEYAEPSGTAAQVAQFYTWLVDVEVMVYIGFGFLMTFLRRYSASAVSLNFFTSAIVTLAAVLLVGAVQQGVPLGEGGSKIKLGLPLVIDAAFCAASAMIAFGAVLGKTTPTQLLWVLLGLVPFYALNQHVVFETLGALDIGGSITIHAFGALYGLAASMVLSCKRQTFTAYTSQNVKNSASYTSNVFSLIGTLMLWLYWPSFNGALAAIDVKDADSPLAPQQYYCVVNTLFSLLGSCVSTFMVSALFNDGKFDLMHIQNASLAGGVAMGSSAGLRLAPGGALAIGLAAGAISTLGFARLSPFMESRLALGDTCGVLNLHGLPGLLGGFIAGIAAVGQAPGVAAHQGGLQLGYQVLALVATAGIAIGSGALVAALATGRVPGASQLSAARERRRLVASASAKAASDLEGGDMFAGDGGSGSTVAIDGLALFDDAIFITDVALETPQVAGHAADITNYSRRAGSAHYQNSNANNPRSSSSAHGGGVHHQSAHGGNMAALGTPSAATATAARANGGGANDGSTGGGAVAAATRAAAPAGAGLYGTAAGA